MTTCAMCVSSVHALGSHASWCPITVELMHVVGALGYVDVSQAGGYTSQQKRFKLLE